MLAAQAQDPLFETPVDSLYREDQFYVGLTFNLLVNQPKEFRQNGFSGGFHAGFIRDMPINKRRNLSIGVGLGWSAHVYNSNLFFGEQPDGSSIIDLLDNTTINFDSNRLHTQSVVLPFQLRWRTSRVQDYTFWRVYPGFRLSYIYHYKAQFEQPNNRVIQTDIPELDRWRYSLTLSAGNGIFNAFVLYDLNSILSSGTTSNGQAIDLRALQFGVEFYIL
jgi:hypothetical protein